MHKQPARSSSSAVIKKVRSSVDKFGSYILDPEAGVIEARVNVTTGSLDMLSLIVYTQYGR